MKTWFKHSITASMEPKLQRAICGLGPLAGFAYWVIMENLYSHSGEISFSDENLNLISRTYLIDNLDVVKKLITDYDLFYVTRGKKVRSKELDHAQTISDIRKRSVERRWERCSETQPTTVCCKGEKTENEKFCNTFCNTSCNTKSIQNAQEERAIEKTKESNTKKEKRLPREEREKSISNDILEEKRDIFTFVKDNFNQVCSALPKVIMLTEARKAKIKLRVEEMGKIGDWKEVYLKVLKLINESPFMAGDNKNNWTATFDWLFDNDKNWVKVYEGNYSKTSSGLNKQSTIKVNDLWTEGF